MADDKPKKLPPKARTTSGGRTTGGTVKKPSPPARKPVEAEAGAPARAKAGPDDAPSTTPAATDGSTDATGGIDKEADAAEVAEAAGTKAEGKPVAPKAGKRPPKTKISRADSRPGASGRYTPPTPHLDEMPSPTWVPILMFTMFGLGMLVIFLNYVELLPGATTNWYLLVGLGLILGGIITATQYR